MGDASPLERVCPACGARIPQQARFCGACGAESQPTEALPVEQPVAAQSIVQPAPEAAPAPAPVRLSAARVDGRVCMWCGAFNAVDANRCVSCDAVFPTPEGDAALETAAMERIKSMESEMGQRRGWWPFRQR